MSSASTCVVIANPAAGRHGAARLLPAVREALAGRGVHDVRVTTRPGEERELALTAALGGADCILALGGDGTWGNVTRGILASGRDVRLALLAAGTGNDLAFATGVPAHEPRAAIDIALGTSERRIDAGRVDDVHFVNVAGFGFDAEVLRAAQRVRWLRGHAVYLVTAVRKLFGYTALHAAIDAPGDSGPRAWPDDHHLAIVIANGPRFGGGFLIAPGASVLDGALDLIRIGDASLWRRAALLARVTRGTHLAQPEVSRQSCTAVDLTFVTPPYFDADGELHCAAGTRVAIRCLPAALRLAVPAAR